MKSTHLSSNGSSADKGDGREAAVNQLSEEVVLGDLIWVRIHGSSWWPAQVADDNTVSQKIKPRDRSAGDVLVRLYGSYKYMYVDSRTYQLEFEKDIVRSKSHRGKRKESQFEGKVRVGSPRGKKAKQNITKTVQSTGALGNHPDVKVVETGMLRADRDARNSVYIASEDVETGERSPKKNLIESGTTSRTSHSQTRISQRILAAANTSDAKVNNSNSLSGKTRKAKSTKQTTGEKQNNVDLHSPKFTSISPRTIAGGSQPKMKNGNSTSAITNDKKSNRQRGVQSESKNQNLVQKKIELNSPSSATTPAGKSEQLTARRIKVMQCLGLIAPSGSPFH
ncbi:uncharacterized protein LOC127800760 isoform X2 [Diospyros lotus]|uniref:uncharacterized protein LOC127800760 isoform X2 n=1 Tax=Diospyros lotus TaxID=55363 RepID=UPI00224EF183|nr:uncharacterized protein LOC127800760 isoform X2 [Diospyros lotus]